MRESYRRIFMPYCLQRQPDGRYVILNRRYKPLGFITTQHVDYGAYPINVKMRMTPAQAARLSWNGDRNTDCIWLYNDGCVPDKRNPGHMKAYLERIERLMSYVVIDE